VVTRAALQQHTEVVYVSPRSLPLAAQRGIPLAPIHAGLRTGDTPQWERDRMTKQYPHILTSAFFFRRQLCSNKV